MTTILIIVSILLFILAGLAFIPALPIVPLQVFIITILSILSAHDPLTTTHIIVFLALVALSFLVDYGAGGVGATFGGAHTSSVTWGIIGGLLGTIVAPPFGGLIGAPLFVFLSERRYKQGVVLPLQTAGYSVMGVLGGMVLNGFLAFITAILFLIFVF